MYRIETLYSCSTHYNVPWHFLCEISMATQWVPGTLYPKGKVGVRLLKKCYFALEVHSMGVSKHGHYPAQAQESLSASVATNKAFFILGR